MLDQLRQLIEANCRGDGLIGTADPDLTLFRSRKPGRWVASPPDMPLREPALCVVVAGHKAATIGTRRVAYEPGFCTVSSVELPVTNMTVDATEAEPFLGLRLSLDQSVLSELWARFTPPTLMTVPDWPVSASPLTGGIVEPLIRLLRHLDDPLDLAVIAPDTRREVIYRLMRGAHGGILAQLANRDSRLSQVMRSITHIRSTFTEPLHIAELAKMASMSTSSFHDHFKRITTMTPLQYQKQLRLHEARRLIFEGSTDAARAGFAVGYESPSQFSREYKRLFGAPPLRDATRFRQAS
ncbi:AraC family transcriptional regulator [Streptomyces olivaceus]|uniref:AraC family transcriptional regulator n=1 Tax=Streptomyces olivaceus TaxID=47716 RepID=UPI0022ED8370|nr:AraC family transcriptional regulator [Streptomyces olivaceus]GHI99317.1 AraC family transcriptional regulator [Streptomyces olivaceus]